MKQEGAARRRGDKAKAPPDGGPPPPPPPDVEMQEEAAGTATGAGGEAGGEKQPQRELDAVTLEDIKEHVKQLEKAVSGKEPRYVLRALRALPSTSRRLNPNVLHKAIHGFFTSNSAVRDFLLGFLEEPMDTEAELQFRPRMGKAASAPLLPEVETYLQLLLVIFLMNSKRYPEAQKVSDDLMQKISTQNRRALDLVVAKCYYYHSRIYEFLNKLDVVRSFLHARLRTATLRHDADGQATLLNLLLRNYLHYNLYDQAEKLVSKSVFPEQANNNEWARYLYYTGRIKAIQLEYSGGTKDHDERPAQGAAAHGRGLQADGAQAADRGGAAARGDPRQAAVQAALPQALADALFPPDSGYDAPALLFQHRVPQFGGAGGLRGSSPLSGSHLRAAPCQSDAPVRFWGASPSPRERRGWHQPCLVLPAVPQPSLLLSLTPSLLSPLCSSCQDWKPGQVQPGP
uniref:Proteasome 26S subunit, non-ATPase 3 n=1 Tax=Anas platyrhynchos TaxID=8839 RepID=A0A8B9TXD0_ANAPL